MGNVTSDNETRWNMKQHLDNILHNDVKECKLGPWYK